MLYVFVLRYHLSAVFFIDTSIGGKLSVLLYFLVIFAWNVFGYPNLPFSVIRLSVSCLIIYIM